MRSIPRKVFIAVVGALAACVVLIPAGPASAQTLNGLWPPFTRCPVDNPALLATNGVTAAPLCIANSSPDGEIKLGNTTATTGNTNLQLGGVANDAGVSVFSPPGGALVADPVQVPGGLLGLMCPSSNPLVAAVCNSITNSTLNRVTATVRPAGEPSDFDTSAALQQGVPIVTLPVKVELDNPLLAPGCSIGSDDDPIVLRPENTTQPNGAFDTADLDGTPNPAGILTRITTQANQGDDSFAVPGASNCGLLGLIDAAVNLQQGLPSPSGNNYLVLDNATASVMTTGVTPVTGQQFADGYHAAEQP